MATITIRREYEDGEILFGSDLDAIIEDVETFLNTTRINDDNIQNAGITASDKLVDATVTASKLASNAVTTTKILDDAVTQAKMADASVGTAQLIDANVTVAKLATDSVETAKIKDLNVTTGKLAADAVTEEKLADDAVSTDKIVDEAVTGDKIAEDTISRDKFTGGTSSVMSVSSGGLPGGTSTLGSFVFTGRPFLVIIQPGSTVTPNTGNFTFGTSATTFFTFADTNTTRTFSDGYVKLFTSHTAGTYDISFTNFGGTVSLSLVIVEL